MISILQVKALKSSITKLQKQDAALKKSEERYRLVIEGASNGLWDWDLTNDMVYISKEWSSMLGFEDQEISSYYIKWTSLIYKKDVERVHQNFNSCLAGKSQFYNGEYRIKLKNNRYIWVSSRGKVLRDAQGKAIRIAGSHTDITEWKRAEKKLERLAYYDALTDIPLRRIFMDRLKVSIMEAKNNGLKLAVLFIDVDNFKTINDTYGHNIGDKLLKKIAAKLKSCIGNTDTLCRMGGDEFALLVPSFSNMNYLDEKAQEIIELFHKPMYISGHKIYNTISVGIAVYPDNGDSGETILKKADIAMYKAKESGKNSLKYYNNFMSREINLRNDIRNDLKEALNNGEFFLCYQPLIDAKTKKMVWMEALIRWKHPTKGIINPVDFIPIAEEMRLIIPIGEWVLENACKQLKKWHEEGFTGYGLSVNVSAVQLQQPDFAEVASRILMENELSTEYMELEITESAFLGEIHTVTRNLNNLRKHGFKISLDDFGTGYNSLSYLQKLLINTIKIDRTFVGNIEADINKVIIDTVISLGHNINAEITAEGVETKDQYDYLKNKGCDKIQGYYFSKPLLPDELIKFLKSNHNKE